MDFLTKERLEAELRSFVRQHMQSVIDEGNRELIAELAAKIIDCDALQPKQLAVLTRLDITTAQQSAFIEHLSDTYGVSFSSDTSFQRLIDNAFALTSEESHFIKFISRCDLNEYLDAPSSEPVQVLMEQLNRSEEGMLAYLANSWFFENRHSSPEAQHDFDKQYGLSIIS